MTVLVGATLELSDSGCRIGGDWYQWGEVVSLDPATRSLSHLTGGKGDYANAPLRSENLKGDARRRFGDWLSQVRLHFAFGSDTSPNWKVTKRDLAARILVNRIDLGLRSGVIQLHSPLTFGIGALVAADVVSPS